MRCAFVISWFVLAAGCAAEDAGGEGGPDEPEPGVTVDGVPTEPAALHEYLRGGAYRQWAGESRVHASTGPHGGRVRTFVSPGLLESLGRGGAHGKGAVAIKELYGSGDSVTGWAVEAKVEPESGNGQGWYWYEVFSVQPGARAAFSGRGLALCANCHAAGRDYVLTPFPLQ